jgi:hypothetical protein
MNAISYSISYMLSDTVSLPGLFKSPQQSQAAPHDVSLSPEATPHIAAPNAIGISPFDDDFFDTAFEGLTQAAMSAITAGSSTDGHAIDASPGPFRGYLEDCSPSRIAGWAQDLRPGTPAVHVAIMLGRIVLAELVANLWRADLSAAAIGTGSHAFEFKPDPPIARDLLGAVKVIRIADKAELPRVFGLINQQG